MLPLATAAQMKELDRRISTEKSSRRPPAAVSLSAIARSSGVILARSPTKKARTWHFCRCRAGSGARWWPATSPPGWTPTLGPPAPAVVAGAAEHGNPRGGVGVFGLHDFPELRHLPLRPDLGPRPLRGPPPGAGPVRGRGHPGVSVPGNLVSRGRGVLFAHDDHGGKAAEDRAETVLLGLEKLPDSLGHGLGGVLHQLQGGGPPLLNGPAVQLLHLGCGG